MIAKAILYQPKASKLCLRTKSIRKRIAARETKKETTNATAGKMISSVLGINPFMKYFTVFKSDALLYFRATPEFLKTLKRFVK